MHISQLTQGRPETVGEVVKEGQEVYVKLLGFDDRGKVRLSMKIVDQATGAEIPRPEGEPEEAVRKPPPAQRSWRSRRWRPPRAPARLDFANTVSEQGTSCSRGSFSLSPVRKRRSSYLFSIVTDGSLISTVLRWRSQ